MPTVSFSINVDPNEPRTNCKVPVSVAIYLIQTFIFSLLVALAIGYNQPAVLIFAAAQAIVTVVFLFNLYYVIVLHLVLQCAGLIWSVGVFVVLLAEAVNRNQHFRHDGVLWIAFLSVIANIYYADLVFRHLKYQRELRSKTTLPTQASAPIEENSNPIVIDNNMGDIGKQVFPLPNLKKF